MSKKVSGLGRGLGELIEDNAPEVRHSGTVIRRDDDKEVSISPEKIKSEEIIDAISNDEYRAPQVHSAVSPIYANQEDSKLTEGISECEKADQGNEAEQVKERPHTSLKAVFRNFK